MLHLRGSLRGLLVRRHFLRYSEYPERHNEREKPKYNQPKSFALDQDQHAKTDTSHHRPPSEMECTRTHIGRVAKRKDGTRFLERSSFQADLQAENGTRQTLELNSQWQEGLLAKSAK